MYSDIVDWPAPKRIFLTTYNCLDHLSTTVSNGVVGVSVNKTSAASKANRLQKNDWILIRLTEFKDHFEYLLIAKVARVMGAATLVTSAGAAGRWPRLLWKEEIESGKVIFPFRIPVTFDNGPHLAPGQITWSALEGLNLRTAKGELLSSAQQWGVKFRGNVIDSPREVHKLVTLVEANRLR